MKLPRTAVGWVALAGLAACGLGCQADRLAPVPAGGGTGGQARQPPGAAGGDAATAGSSGGRAGGGSGVGGGVAGGASSGGQAGAAPAVPGMGSGAGGQTAGAAAPGGPAGTCDAGSSTTAWATACPTSGPSCTPGTWTAGGPDPAHAAFALVSQSTHFAVYSDESIAATTAQAAVDHLETVWSLYFGRPLYMREPLCTSATKIKASIHVHSDWGLTGGAWGDGRMGMWIGTGGLSDHWGLAHEFMHGVQAVEGGLSCDQSNTCGWIYESHANWAAQQQAEYHTTTVHCSEMLANVPHLYLGSTRDRYCNWQFMEYLKDTRCYSAVNAIWTGTPVADPFTAIMNGQGWDVAALDDFIGEWAMHNITWDYQDPQPSPTAGGNQGALFRSSYGPITDTSQVIRRLRTTKLEPLDAAFAGGRRFGSPFYSAPQPLGYNVVRLFPDPGASTVTVTFRGVVQSAPSPDWRWGLVATDAAVTTARYSQLQRGADARLGFCVNAGEALWLVVAATPLALQKLTWDQPYGTVPRYPYMIQVDGAWVEGFRGGTPDACPAGLTRAASGGGCAPPGTRAFVGPYATVLAGATVADGARIEDHAIVARGSVAAGTVGALSLVGSDGAPFDISAGTVKTTFYPLGFFEAGQGLAGGSLLGDVEYRGQGLSRTTGTCSGYVDSATCIDPGIDGTPAPPYAWRD
jgi:hypothetical protein